MLDEWRGPFEDPTHSLSRIVGALGAGTDLDGGVTEQFLVGF